MKFEVLASVGQARVGRLTTGHGLVETPVFMPVATSGAVKSLPIWELEGLGAEIILGNAYHLHSRPGEESIAQAGGLHQWMSWPKPILTDSGGYQAYSLGATRAKRAKTTDEGVRLFSAHDGRKLFLTPESVLDIQLKLGSDISMVLDDCPPHPVGEKRLAIAVERTGEWALRSINHWRSREVGERGIFGIVQGGSNQELRRQSLESVQNLPFDGLAIGGVSVGEGKELMAAAVESIADEMDSRRPRYLMGVGEPIDLISMVARGIDMFDCVLPTRLARHGAFWVKNGYQRLDIRRAEFATDRGALDPDCSCSTCRRFGRDYLRHLFMLREPVAGTYLTIHNLHLILV